MRKFRINRYGLLDHIFDVEMKVWYGWTLIKRFRANVKFHIDDTFEIKYAQERAEELLEKLEEEI